MLRIEEFKTGLLDLYVEHDEALNLDANDKLGLTIIMHYFIH